MNTSGERDRSREESGSEEDPLTKTSPPGDQNHHSYQSQKFHLIIKVLWYLKCSQRDLTGGPLGLHGWPAHPAFAGKHLMI